MNGPEHFREGERLLSTVEQDLHQLARTPPHAHLRVRMANAHFAAAQAAATADLAFTFASYGGRWLPVVGPSGETVPTTGPASTQSAEDGAPVGGEAPNPQRGSQGVSACCGGTGFADYAAVPCPNPECTAPPCGGASTAPPPPPPATHPRTAIRAVIDAAVAWRARIHGGSEASAGASHPNLWGDERDFALIEAVDAYLAAKQVREAAKMEPQTPGARLREAFGEAQAGGRLRVVPAVGSQP